MKGIFEKIRNIVADMMKIDPALIKEDSNFNDDLGIDSIDFIEIIMVVEKEFNIEIPDNEIEGCSTMKELINYIEKVH